MIDVPSDDAPTWIPSRRRTQRRGKPAAFIGKFPTMASNADGCVAVENFKKARKSFHVSVPIVGNGGGESSKLAPFAVTVMKAPSDS